jgi:methionyl aminopeptidase
MVHTVADSSKHKSMREGGKILSSVFDFLGGIVKEGVTARYIDDHVKQFIEKHHAEPGFLGYQGYGYSTCISKNDEIVHGIPYPDKVFFEGDCVSIDVGVRYKGYYVDAARTFLIGRVSDAVRHLAAVTEQSFFVGISVLKSGVRLGDMGYEMQTYIESHGLTVVRDLYSHGVGRSLHEDPLIPNYGKKGSGVKVCRGMSLAIEPMVAMGGADIETLDDNWTIVTKDRQWAAHYENTIIITDNGVDVVTIA